MQGDMDRGEAIRTQVLAIKAKLDAAIDKQVIVSCIGELQSLLSEPNLPPEILSMILNALNEAGEKGKTASSSMQPESLATGIDKKLEPLREELEEEKQELDKISKKIDNCINEMRSKRDEWVQDLFSPAGLEAEQAFRANMMQGVGLIHEMGRRIDQRKAERLGVMARIAAGQENPETHYDYAFLREHLTLIEKHITEEDGKYEAHIDAHAREVQSYITIKSIVESCKDRLSQLEIDREVRAALSQNINSSELGLIKNRLRQDKDLSSEDKIADFDDFIESRVVGKGMDAKELVTLAVNVKGPGVRVVKQNENVGRKSRVDQEGINDIDAYAILRNEETNKIISQSFKEKEEAKRLGQTDKKTDSTKEASLEKKPNSHVSALEDKKNSPPTHIR